jgi:hypothetical protein
MPYNYKPPNTRLEASLSGRQLAYSLRRRSPAQRAILAHQLESGDIVVRGFTRGQAAKLARTSLGYVATINRASEADRERLRLGVVELSHLRNRRDVTDAQVDNFIRRAGAQKVLEGLDRFTRPRFSVAAE